MHIIAYTYRADIFCPVCIDDALLTGPGEPFDGWKSTVPMSAEDNLNEIAFAFGIDRTDEYTFDSDDFPKRVFSSQVENIEQCTKCEETL